MISASPAPWVVGSNGATVKVVDSEGKAVCMLTPRRDQFNGDLIAASPDLLAILKEVREAWLDGRIDDVGGILTGDICRDAIDRALGV
jgi:hypothetical protein